MFFLPWIVYISNDVDREDVRGLNTPWQSLRYTLGWKFVINDGQSFSWVYYLAVQNPLEFSKGICSYEDNISWRFTECDVLPLLYLFFCWENLYGLDGVGRNKSQSFCHNLFSRIRPHLVDGDVQEGVGKGVPSMTHKVLGTCAESGEHSQDYTSQGSFQVQFHYNLFVHQDYLYA